MCVVFYNTFPIDSKMQIYFTMLMVIFTEENYSEFLTINNKVLMANGISSDSLDHNRYLYIYMNIYL
jgi:hypothetical protein